MTEEKKESTVTEKPKQGVSRRQFIAGTVGGVVVGAVVGAATGSLGFPKTITKTSTETTTQTTTVATTAQFWLPSKWDYTADVVVVGYGGAGGAAAIEANDAGAKVLILEKTSSPGGSTTSCGGEIYAGGTSVQAANGINDTADGMYAYVNAVAYGQNTPAVARVYCNNAGATIDWFKKLGGTFITSPPVATDGTYTTLGAAGLLYSGQENEPEMAAITPPKMRGHNVPPKVTPSFTWPPDNMTGFAMTNGVGVFNPIYNGVTSRNIQVLYKTRASQLIANPATKQVLGILAQTLSASTTTAGISYSVTGTVNIKANKAVVLAAGGFGMNPTMTTQYCPEAIGTYWTPSDTGDGIQMGQTLGADLVNMETSLLILSYLPPGAIMVNSGGRRFVDETKYNEGGLAAQAAWGQWNQVVYAIYDTPIQKTFPVPATATASTISALATAIGIDPTVLQDTVNTYNGYVVAGKDLEFGRVGLLPRPNTARMVPISTPPFYALKQASATGLTLGGLKINPTAQVVDVSGNVIPRLYAAGRTTGGTMGKLYPGGGSCVDDALTMGRIAGQNAAKETST